jgi:hypothetical protein
MFPNKDLPHHQSLHISSLETMISAAVAWIDTDCHHYSGFTVSPPIVDDFPSLYSVGWIMLNREKNDYLSLLNSFYPN